MASWNEAYALCPFYDTDEKNAIVCESVFIEGKKTRHSFNTKEKQEHLEQFCNKKYKSCPYYKALKNEKYNFDNFW